jgi:hypothetical protein
VDQQLIYRLLLSNVDHVLTEPSAPYTALPCVSVHTTHELLFFKYAPPCSVLSLLRQTRKARGVDRGRHGVGLLSIMTYPSSTLPSPDLVPTMARPCLSPKQVDDVLAAFFALVGVDPDDLPSLTTPAHFTSPPSTPPLHLTSPTESRTKSSHRGHVKQQRQLLSSKKSLPAGHIVPPGEMKRYGLRVS